MPSTPPSTSPSTPPSIPGPPAAHLDRLSALLAGLAPRVRLSAGCQELGLHIVKPASASSQALRLVVTPRAQPLDTLALGQQGWVLWLSFEVAFDGPVGPMFHEQFRQPLEIDLDAADPSLVQIAQLIAAEIQTPRCGHPLLMNRAGDILLIGLLRHLVASPQGSMHLFNGLADPRIARVLVAMHTRPAHAWSLTLLAQEAGMSRTSFAQHFSRVLGVSPGRYLARLRLAIAQRLVSDGAALKQVARETGYAGPSTLSRALSRAMADQTTPCSSMASATFTNPATLAPLT